MFCPNCGQQHNGGYCPRCGTYAQERTGNTPPAAPPRNKLEEGVNKIAFVIGAIASVFIAFIFLVAGAAEHKSGLFIFTVIFGAAFAYCLLQLKKLDNKNPTVVQSRPAPVQPRTAKRNVVGGLDYLSDKGITPQMIYEMHSRRYKKDGEFEVFFPKKLGQLNFARRFDPNDVCIITTERPNFQKIKLGENVILVPEPTNAYDHKAIVILSQSQKLGYIYRNGLQDILNEKFRDRNVIVGSVLEKKAKSNTLIIQIACYKEN